MLLHLFSDANYNLLGFNATYTFSLCPGACGGHGRCDSSTLKCHCQHGWGGAACTAPLCAKSCSVNGQCDKVRMEEGNIELLCHSSINMTWWNQLCPFLETFFFADLWELFLSERRALSVQTWLHGSELSAWFKWWRWSWAVVARQWGKSIHTPQDRFGRCVSVSCWITIHVWR